MFEKILVPLDGSDLAEYALNHACSLQPRELILLRVPAPQPVPLDSLAGYSWIPSEDTTQRARDESADYLNAVARRLRLTCPVRPIVHGGDEASAILDAAAHEDVDLIVMSTHGYSGFSRWILGSITERVLRAAPCPVLAVRDTQPLKRMIITLDGSRHAESALEPGLALMRRLEGDATLVYVDEGRDIVPPDDPHQGQLEPVPSHTIDTRAYARTDAYVTDLAAKLQHDPVPVSTMILTGHAAPEILQYADDNSIDVIAMATHGRTGLRRWVYGSITEKVLRGTLCALLVVRVPVAELA